jgi:biotin transport system substrate-specific component
MVGATIAAVDAHLPVPGISVERHAPARPTAVVRFVREALLLAAGTAFLALTARISVPLPFSPVPITGQTLGVLLVGALYGPRRGTATVLAYLAEGATGLPVFAAGRAGLPVLLGPTGGFLVGFLPAAAIAGLAGARRRAALRVVLLLLASVAVYACGVPWLMTVTGMTLPAALAAGALPFLPGDVLKAGLAAGVTPAGARVLRLR